MNIAPRGMSVMNLYQLYRTDRLLVNRKYQRKLVWSLAEKEALIDSVLSQYPIPLILLAEGTGSDNEPVYEIIDGMQRLNSLFSFIENQVTINGAYFDIIHHPTANTLAKEGVFEAVDREKVTLLDAKKCGDFLEYQLPISTFQGTEEEVIEVFGRINSNGKHLSPQEVRQAGNTTVFSNLVREISAEIRGDVSREVLPLTGMPEISVDSKKIPLGYGISADETFWCNQGILRVSHVRDSEDEQLIADIILSIVLKEPFSASKDSFDDYYQNDKKKLQLESAIATYGKENLRHDIKLVFDKIKSLTNYGGGDRNFLRNTLNPNSNGNAAKEPYYTLFMGYFRLMITEGMEPLNYDGIISNITNLSSHIKSGKSISTSNRITNIDLAYGLLLSHFRKAKHSLRSIGTLSIDFENYIRSSKVEPAFYDFKQGFYTLDNERIFDERSFQKIGRNIAAMANLGKNRVGWLFIGVTDREEHTKRIETLDGITAQRIGEFGIVGLEREAAIKKVSIDQYTSFITGKINSLPLPENLKSNVVSKMNLLNYKGNSVLILEIECGEEPCWFEQELYVRDGGSCKLVQGQDVGQVFARFR